MRISVRSFSHRSRKLGTSFATASSSTSAISHSPALKAFIAIPLSSFRASASLRIRPSVPVIRFSSKFALPRICNHAWPACRVPRYYIAAWADNYFNVHPAYVAASHFSPRRPRRFNQSTIGTDFLDRIKNILVAPITRKLCLSRLPGASPMASTSSIAVQDVFFPFGRDCNATTSSATLR